MPAEYVVTIWSTAFPLASMTVDTGTGKQSWPRYDNGALSSIPNTVLNQIYLKMVAKEDEQPGRVIENGTRIPIKDMADNHENEIIYIAHINRKSEQES